MVLFFILSPISLTFSVTASFAFVNAPVMVSLIASNFSLMLLHNSDSFSLTVSQFLYRATPAAISPPISATIMIIGHRFITAFNAVCAAVIPPVVAVAAVVAAVCAAVAAVPAVSAAVPAAVAAVFAVIFAIIFAAPDTNFCPVVIVLEIPFATFPNPIDNGPIAATTRPTLRIVCCWLSSKCPNHSLNRCTFSVNSFTIGAADDITVCPNCNVVFFNSFNAIFISYDVVFILLNAVSVAPVEFLISCKVPLKESAPSPKRINPAFAASDDENISPIDRFCSFAASLIMLNTSARLEPLDINSPKDFPVFSLNIVSVVLPVFPSSFNIEFIYVVDSAVATPFAVIIA